MSATAFTRAIQEVVNRKMAEAAGVVQQATVTDIDPIMLELVESGITLHDDEFELTQGMVAYDRDSGLEVGDTVLIVRKHVSGEIHWDVFDVLADGDPAIGVTQAYVDAAIATVNASITAVSSSAVIKAPTTSARNDITPTSASVVPLRVTAAPGQTANLQEWRNSSGVNLATVSATGVFTAGQIGTTFLTDSTNTVAYMTTSFDSTTAWLLTNRLPARTVYAVRGAASQSADLQQWQNSSGANLVTVSAMGVFTAGQIGTTYLTDTTDSVAFMTTAFNSTTAWLLTNRLPARTVYAVRGAASQSADLQQWQNSSGGVLASVTAGGQIYAASGIRVGASATAGRVLTADATGVGTWQSIPATDYSPAVILAPGSSTRNVVQPTGNFTPIVARGSAGQTANLQEWQNSSATVLAKISSTGFAEVADFTSNSYIRAHYTGAGSPGTNSVLIGWDGPANAAASAVTFGPSLDVMIRRSASDYLRTNAAIGTSRTSAPADASLAAGQVAIWLDQTAGATKIKFKAKDSAGTVRQGEVALT